MLSAPCATDRGPRQRGRRVERFLATLSAAICLLTLVACGSDAPDRNAAGAAPPPGPPATAPRPTDGPVAAPTLAQAERLRVALATNLDPSLARRFERVAPLAVLGCRTMRGDPTGERWDETLRTAFVAAGFSGFTARDASLFLEVLRSDYCPIGG